MSDVPSSSGTRGGSSNDNVPDASGSGSGSGSSSAPSGSGAPSSSNAPVNPDSYYERYPRNEEGRICIGTEAEYMDNLYSCVSFNRKLIDQRKRSIPFYDQSTNMPFYPTNHLTRHYWERLPVIGNQVARYPPHPYKKPSSYSTQSSSDAIEFRHIVNSDPQLKNAVEKLNEGTSSSSATATNVGEQSNDSLASKVHGKTNFEGLNDDFFNSGNEDDEFFEKKKRSRKRGQNAKEGASSRVGRKSNAQATPVAPVAPVPAIAEVPKPAPAEKRFQCHECAARYKSRTGLSYHKLHVHTARTTAIEPRSPLALSPGLNISETCDFCQGTKKENLRTNQPEDLVSCHDCGRSAHPSCLNFTPNMITSFKRHGWQCIECKSCAICGTSDNDDRLLFCDDCDRGFHCDCLTPPLAEPPANEWSCGLCQEFYGANASAPKQ